jgi:hypothetical protein
MLIPARQLGNQVESDSYPRFHQSRTLRLTLERGLAKFTSSGRKSKQGRRAWSLASVAAATCGLLLLTTYFLWGDRLFYEDLYPPMKEPWLAIVRALQAAFLATGPLTLCIAVVALVRESGSRRHLSVVTLLISLVLCFYLIVVLTLPV